MIKHLIASLAMLPMVASAGYVGSETQSFNPNIQNLDFISNHSSRTLSSGTLKATLFLDYASNVHYNNAGNMQNDVIQSQLGFAFGITDKLDLGLAGSFLLDWSEDNTTGQYTDDVPTFVRLTAKYNVFGDENGGLAAVFGFGYGLLSNDYFVGNDEDNMTASLVLAYDRMLTDNIRMGLNLGYKYLTSGDTAAATDLHSAGNYPALTEGRTDGQILYGLAFNYMFNDSITGLLELYGQNPADELDFTPSNNAFDEKGAEVLLGLNFAAANGLDISAGATAGVFNNADNADMRVFLGAGYAFGNAEAAAFNSNGYSAPMAKSDEPAYKPVAAKDAPVVKEFNITAKFPSGSSTLTSSAKGQIDQVVSFLNGYPKYTGVLVEGHTDSAGGEAMNQSLSEKRAQAVANYIKSKGVNADKVSVIGYGESNPMADNATAAGRAQNRRVVVKVK